MKDIDLRSFLFKGLLRREGKKIESVKGSLMIMDISGFTELSERMCNFGKEGTEELTKILNNYFSSMLKVIKKYQGIPLKFGGDSILVGFYGDKEISKELSSSCAISLMNEIEKFKSIDTIVGKAGITMKIVIETGEWKECILGDNRRAVLFLSGDLIKRIAQYEEKANPNEVWINGRIEKKTDLPQTTENKLLFINETQEGIDKDSIFKFIPEGVIEFIKSGISGEHRVVTTLFVNLYGYDEEHPEINYINKVFVNIIDIIEKYKGSINKIDINNIGSKIMITFGAPFSHEKSTEFALLSAMEIKNIESPFKIKIGVSTGYVYAGIVGSEYQKEYTVIGDCVNIAARIMSKSPVNQILIDESTKRIVQDLFEFEVIEPINVKGKTKPLKVYLPKKEIQRKFYRFSCVGRDKEIEKILNMTQKGNSIIFIKGEPGIGKTRLIDEIRTRLDDNFKILIGNANELKSAYSPFTNLIVNESGITPEEDLQQKKKKLEEHITSLKNEELIKRIPLMASMLLNIKYPDSIYEKVEPKLKIENLKDALRYYIESQKQKKIVLILDDTHLLTGEDIEIINYLTRVLLKLSKRKEDISFIFTGRTSPSLDSEILIPDGIQYVNIQLEPLNKTNTDKLITEILKNKKIPYDVLEMLLKRTEGNPFYIEQYLLNIIEKGFLKEMETEWIKTELFKEEELPENIWAAIMSRVDRLENVSKECLVIGSVIGLEFSGKIISSILNRDVQEPLKVTVREGLTYVRMRKEIEYIFRHALIKDVIYDSILIERKRFLHNAVGETIEKLNKDNIHGFYGILAYHYNNACDWEKAYEYSYRAGDYSKQNYKNEDAIKFYRDAISISVQKLCKKPGINIYVSIGEIYEILGKYDEAIEIYDEMYNYDRNDKLNIIKSFRMKANILQNQSKYDEALQLLNEASKIYSEIPESMEAKIEYGNIFGLLSWIYRIRCDYKYSLEIANKTLNEILEYSQKNNISNKELKKVIGNLYNNIGMTYSIQGDYQKAIEFYEKALETSKELGDKRDTGAAYNNLGNIYANRGEYEKAIECYMKKLKISEEIGDKKGIGTAYNNIGLVKSDLGKYSEAIECYNQKLKISEELNDKRGKGMAYGNLGIVYANLGEYDKAIEFYEKILNISEEINDALGIAIVNGNIGDVYFDKGEYENALEFYKKYYEISEKIGFKRGIGISNNNIGNVYIELKDYEEAKKRLIEARKIFEELDDRYYLIQTLNFLSKVELECGTNINVSKEYAYRALELSRSSNIKEGEAMSLISIGKVILISSILEKSEDKKRIGLETIEKGINIFIEFGLLKNLGESLLECGKILKRFGVKDYLKYFDEAINIFKKMKNEEKCRRIERLKEIY